MDYNNKTRRITFPPLLIKREVVVGHVEPTLCKSKENIMSGGKQYLTLFATVALLVEVKDGTVEQAVQALNDPESQLALNVSENIQGALGEGMDIDFGGRDEDGNVIEIDVMPDDGNGVSPKVTFVAAEGICTAGDLSYYPPDNGDNARADVEDPIDSSLAVYGTAHVGGAVISSGIVGNANVVIEDEDELFDNQPSLGGAPVDQDSEKLVPSTAAPDDDNVIFKKE